jgi:putative NADH-flavin reductase
MFPLVRARSDKFLIKKNQSMRVLIFGASGYTGKQLVKQALAMGHDVTAFVRDAAKLDIVHDRLEVIVGNVRYYRSVENAIKGQDAVISALGVSQTLHNDPIVIEGIKNIVEAMERLNVPRLIYLSFIAVGNGRKDAGFMIKHLISRIVRKEIEDHEKKERLISDSLLRWTIIHPPKLTNNGKKGIYRTGEAIKAKSILPMISRADVADFMLRQLTDDRFMYKATRVMY